MITAGASSARMILDMLLQEDASRMSTTRRMRPSGQDHEQP
jgi:hypothetical protein